MPSDIPRKRMITEACQNEGILDHQTSMGSLQYSPQYSDENYVYRHINVPRRIVRKAKELLKAYNKRLPRKGQLQLGARTDRPILPYEDVVTKLYVHMSNDWALYLIHDRDATLCFRRQRRDLNG